MLNDQVKITPEMVAQYAAKDSRAVMLVETKDLMDELMCRLYEGNGMVEMDAARQMFTLLKEWAVSKDYDSFALDLADPLVEAYLEKNGLKVLQKGCF